MSQRLLQELRNENLCTYFVLPLLKLSKVSFMHTNFINSFLAVDGYLIVVEVIALEYLSRRLFTHSLYRGTKMDKEGHYYLTFGIPYTWHQDVDMFKEGRFSEMSLKARDTIKQHSGLDWNASDPDRGIVSDARLMALEKHPKLREWWDKALTYTSPEGTVVIPSYMENVDELLSIPDERSYIDLETLIDYKP